jgi:hypothetical protein
VTLDFGGGVGEEEGAEHRRRRPVEGELHPAGPQEVAVVWPQSNSPSKCLFAVHVPVN